MILHRNWVIFALVLANVFSAAVGYAERAPGEAADTADPAELKHVGVSMIPYQHGLGDEDDDKAAKLIGDTSLIQYNYTPKDAKTALETVRKFAKLDKRIDLLLIIGHGGSDRPHIRFSKGDLVHNDVDIDHYRKQKEGWEKQVRRLRDEGQDASLAEKRLEEADQKLSYLESVSDGMAPGAVLLLINCYAAKGEGGLEFTKAMGKTFLGKHGGTIIASRNAAGIGIVYVWILQQIGTWFSTGEWIPGGDFYIQGDWVKLKIPPRGALPPEWIGKVDWGEPYDIQREGKYDHCEMPATPGLLYSYNGEPVTTENVASTSTVYDSMLRLYSDGSLSGETWSTSKQKRESRVSNSQGSLNGHVDFEAGTITFQGRYSQRTDGQSPPPRGRRRRRTASAETGEKKDSESPSGVKWWNSSSSSYRGSGHFATASKASEGEIFNPSYAKGTVSFTYSTSGWMGKSYTTSAKCDFEMHFKARDGTW